VLSPGESALALKNALRYFPAKHHRALAPEFARELKEDGRITMRRYRPHHEMHARPIDEYPARTREAAAIMVMIQNNLDPKVAQHPYELITYGGNGAVFQNWAQYRLTMKYLSEMTGEQTLVLYSGHPLGLFPSHRDAPRVVVTNGMVIPNHSAPSDYERLSALGVTSYGQMTAGSFMYIGPQGIVHGTVITLLNAGRKYLGTGDEALAGRVFVTSGLGGMSGAQPKAAVIAGAVGIVAEVNPTAVKTRFDQGWVMEVETDLDKLLARAERARRSKEAVSIAYVGNVVDLWERLAKESVAVDLGSDQTSLHNPFGGGYYPAGLSFDDGRQMLRDDPAGFKARVEASLRRHVDAINRSLRAGCGSGTTATPSARGRPRRRCRDAGRRDVHVSELRRGRHGSDVLRLRLRPVPVGLHQRPADLAARTDRPRFSRGWRPVPRRIKPQLLDNARWIRKPSRTSSSSEAKRGSFTPTVRDASASPWPSTRRFAQEASSLRSCSGATTTTCREPTHPTARRRTSGTAPT
jgi:hypothetical protein